MLKIYGIKNCSSVKKALDFLKNNDIEFDFHDYKKLGANEVLVSEFIKNFSFELVLNKKGMTYRNLDKNIQEKCSDQNFAINLMCEKTSLIKRPIILGEGKKLIGFDEEEYKKEML